jgi:hypothetical protein
MRPLNRREKILGILTAVVVGGMLLFLVMIDPQLKRHGELSKQVDHLQLVLTKMQTNIRIRDSIEARYASLENLIKDSKGPGQEMAHFTQLLSELYKPLNLDVKTVSPLPDTNEGTYAKYALRVEMSGMIDEICLFLAELVTAAETVRVERLDVICKDRPNYLNASIIISKMATHANQ